MQMSFSSTFNLITLTITTLTVLCLIQVPIIYIDDKSMVIWSVISFPIFIPLGCHSEQYEVSKGNQTEKEKIAKQAPYVGRMHSIRRRKFTWNEGYWQARAKELIHTRYGKVGAKEKTFHGVRALGRDEFKDGPVSIVLPIPTSTLLGMLTVQCISR